MEALTSRALRATTPADDGQRLDASTNPGPQPARARGLREGFPRLLGAPRQLEITARHRPRGHLARRPPRTGPNDSTDERIGTDGRALRFPPFPWTTTPTRDHCPGPNMEGISRDGARGRGSTPRPFDGSRTEDRHERRDRARRFPLVRGAALTARRRSIDGQAPVHRPSRLGTRGPTSVHPQPDVGPWRWASSVRANL